MHAAEARIARLADTRWREAVEAVATGYSIARSKKALRTWQRRRGRSSKPSVGLTGKALDQAMAGALMVHPEFLKGVARPRHLQPRSLWAEAAKVRRSKGGP